jgi:hypothetical protein
MERSTDAFHSQNGGSGNARFVWRARPSASRLSSIDPREALILSWVPVDLLPCSGFAGE